MLLLVMAEECLVIPASAADVNGIPAIWITSRVLAASVFDLDKFLPVLLGACDTHVERIAVTEREASQRAQQFEFNSVFLAVHRTETLAVLRLREIAGLTNPDFHNTGRP
ncbi:hypothetical protein FJU30_09200 [Affinibrenneria salicis]|uniref:Uncharacterized protein n=1 Tax=Affinibrenneria salicis TaxID=2590031 RepID=A0A5J5G3D4_9GAMM|nr:hypothetical protein [Affinibrenneria salicis]KAA9001379.1 hypothetical protein FJU30_09200 [Affinibrenneria salicis]